MNQRIRELAKCNERIENFFVTGPVQRAAIEEFAELIVKECANAIREDAKKFPAGDLAWTSAMEESAKVAMKHFGVEE